MGVVMMVGIVVSNSILIVEFTHRLLEQGMPIREAVAMACRVRLRPVLMTSLATIIGLMPMALKLGTGSESYAPLAQAIIGGLSLSVIFTIFLVPAAFLLVYGSRTSRWTRNESTDDRFIMMGRETRRDHAWRGGVVALLSCADRRGFGAGRPASVAQRRRTAGDPESSTDSRRTVRGPGGRRERSSGEVCVLSHGLREPDRGAGGSRAVESPLAG